MTTRPITRRSVLGGAAAVGGAAVLAACGSDDDGGDAATEPGTGAEETEAIDEGEDLAEGQDPVEEEEILIAAVEVPIGGGVIIGSAGVVVTQPTMNEFKGFSSTCTHQGCQVSSVEGDTIRCACHNSTFSVDDGSVLGGPATAPLPEVPVVLAGDQVVSG
jgi:Rieske Fe-S protein